MRDSRVEQSLPVVLESYDLPARCEMNLAEFVFNLLDATAFFSYSNLRPVTVLRVHLLTSAGTGSGRDFSIRVRLLLLNRGASVLGCPHSVLSR